MQLTNYSFLDSRNNYLSAKSFHKVAMQRLSTGTKIERSGSDAGALSQSMRSRFDMMGDRSFITNLQNTRSFLHSQEAGLNTALKVYNRMEEITIRATDPTLSQADRSDYNDEFKVLTEQLTEIMESEFNGRKLFNDSLICGGAKDIPLGQLDLVTPGTGKPAGITHAVRAQEIDVNSPAGTLSFRVNSGGDADIYRVWMGGTCVFSAGPSFNGPDHTQQYNDPPGFTWPGGGWMTSDNARTEDDDLIEVTFAPGKQTTYKITPGASNDDGTGNSKFNTHDPVTGLYANILTNDLAASFTSSMLTLQIETDSIGIIYSEGSSANGDADNSGTPGVTFVPDIFELPVTIDIHGNQMGLDPKGFGTLTGDSPVTGAPHSLDTIANASDTLDHLRGNKYSNDPAESYYGEEKCIISERLAAVGAEINRIDLEIGELQNQVTTGEQASGRISDADIAREATQLAKALLKMNLAEQIMSKSARLKDILIPLTTNHHRGAVLSSTL
jgi:flagellin-like hook-associated protein FlgL